MPLWRQFLHDIGNDAKRREERKPEDKETEGISQVIKKQIAINLESSEEKTLNTRKAEQEEEIPLGKRGENETNENKIEESESSDRSATEINSECDISEWNGKVSITPSMRESIAEREIIEKTIPAFKVRHLVIGHKSPKVNLRSNTLELEKAQFYIDSGAEISIIKGGKLKENRNIYKRKVVGLYEVTPRKRYRNGKKGTRLVIPRNTNDDGEPPCADEDATEVNIYMLAREKNGKTRLKERPPREKPPWRPNEEKIVFSWATAYGRRAKKKKRREERLINTKENE